MSRSIEYGNLMHRAMRGLIQEVLGDVAENGLPGNHHFFITFDTTHPGSALADWLKERYPKEMTVVLQHWYDNLEVGDEGFGITLNFGDSPENMYIPYDAILTFVDPSVEFGLRFETQGEDEEEAAPEQAEPLRAPRDDEPETKPEPHAADKEGEVVQLDKFRK
ncbi:hypothetical protein SAMN05421762_1893 [Pseudooceanicola nitratireducens]|uniref:Stringent starvation protein B n=1 Tax=Pseudooceanicola nitratireducens TaxID=517719 RepID=A0A1I1LDE8_9RHOB|nr:ClpXP protease specificity-enhancing factor SspB [Pseudooceanicola nitratireducens]SEJ61532.1 hypothetical protein SAMN05216183_10499 [Pseudooceanicola nitratireducens]SFC71015.1 hypothetical protein SAMN05421762_1893 [Pseudooceanicola nitratireducens]